MPITCDCGKVHQAVPQNVFDERLGEKITAIGALNTTMKELQTRATGFEGAQAELGTERKAREAAEGRYRKFETMVGLGYTNARVITSIDAIHGAEMAGLAADKQVDLATWIASDAGKTHPVVVALARPAGPGTTTLVPTTILPPANTGAADPSASAKMTPKQVSEYLASPAFTGLAKDAQKTKLAELQASHKDGETSVATTV